MSLKLKSEFIKNEVNKRDFLAVIEIVVALCLCVGSRTLTAGSPSVCIWKTRGFPAWSGFAFLKIQVLCPDPGGHRTKGPVFCRFEAVRYTVYSRQFPSVCKPNLLTSTGAQLLGKGVLSLYILSFAPYFYWQFVSFTYCWNWLVKN